MSKNSVIDDISVSTSSLEKEKLILNGGVKEKTHKVSISNATIPGRFLETCQKYPENDALLYKKDHTFGHIQYKRLLNLVQNFTLSLEKIGIKKGDRVVLISENRPEWVVADLSVKSLGAILVPIHKVSTPEQVREIAYEVEPSLIIVSDAKTMAKAELARKSIKKDTPVIFYEIHDNYENITPDKDHDFIKALQLIEHDEFDEHFENLVIQNDNPNDVASIIYTPSAKGGYRGVQLTHQNFISNVLSTKEAIVIRNDDRFMSILPLSHAFEKTAGYYVPLFSGATISYLTNMSEFSNINKEYRPTVIIGVPRLYEKTYSKAVEKINKSKLKKYFFNRAAKKQLNKFNPSSLFYEAFIYKKIRDSFGGQLRFVVSGGASLKPEVGTFFKNAGIPMLEGYGLTETAPIVSVNRIENHKIGTVGQTLPNVSVRIAEDGEILVKGKSVTPGYFNNEIESHESFKDGWFKTGDYGSFDNEGFLKITGKKKEIIVLTSGKNVSPQSIESQVVKSRFIKQSLVVGDGCKCIASIIVPEIEQIKDMLPSITDDQIFSSGLVKELIQNDINILLSDFARHEQLKKIVLASNLKSEINNRRALNINNDQLISSLLKDCC